MKFTVGALLPIRVPLDRLPSLRAGAAVIVEKTGLSCGLKPQYRICWKNLTGDGGIYNTTAWVSEQELILMYTGKEEVAKAASKKFWVVWKENGTNPPRKRHTTRELAVAEAERLASIETSGIFYVLEAVAKAARVAVVSSNID